MARWLWTMTLVVVEIELNQFAEAGVTLKHATIATVERGSVKVGGSNLLN